MCGVKPLSARSSQRSHEVAVDDRRARHLAAEPQEEGLVDRPGDGVGVEPAVPGAQPLDRGALALARRVAGARAAAPPRGRAARARRSASRRSPRGRASPSQQQFFDPLGAEAVEPFGGDVVRVVVADDPVVGGDQVAGLGVDDLRQLLVGDRPLPLELAGPARLRQVGDAAAGGSAAGRSACSRSSRGGRPRSRSRRARCGRRSAGDELRPGGRRRAVRTCRGRRSVRAASARRGRAARRRRRRAPR